MWKLWNNSVQDNKTSNGTSSYKLYGRKTERYNVSYPDKMTNSVHKGKYPKLWRMNKPLQWQGMTEINTDREGEGDD
jgi:uncharacterized protein (DUF2147 family)